MNIKMIRKKMMVILICMSILCIMVGCKQQTPKENNTATDNNTKNITDIKDETEQKQGDLLIHNIKLNANGASNMITGKVKNEGSDTLGFTLVLNMYKKDHNKLVGTAQTNIKKLQPNAEKDFNISITGNYKNINKFSVKILNLVKNNP